MLQTGLEQYYWERAGYYVRRGLLTLDILKIINAELIIAELVTDTLGRACVLLSREFPMEAVWNKDDAGMELLVYAAQEPVDTLLVLPGTHETPPEAVPAGEEQIEGQVRVRLETGDTLFLNPGVWRRERYSSPEKMLRLRFGIRA